MLAVFATSSDFCFTTRYSVEWVRWSSLFTVISFFSSLWMPARSSATRRSLRPLEFETLTNNGVSEMWCPHTKMRVWLLVFALHTNKESSPGKYCKSHAELPISIKFDASMNFTRLTRVSPEQTSLLKISVSPFIPCFCCESKCVRIYKHTGERVVQMAHAQWHAHKGKPHAHIEICTRTWMKEWYGHRGACRVMLTVVTKHARVARGVQQTS